MLKTYNREELKQLNGKKVRSEEENELCKIHNTGNLHIDGRHAFIGRQDICSLEGVHKYKFELLENEFEVGEEVEVRDDNYEERDKMIFLGIVPRAIYKYVVVDTDWESEYHRWSEVYCVHYRKIRKIQPKPEPKKMTMEELNKELWYEVEIVEKK